MKYISSLCWITLIISLTNCKDNNIDIGPNPYSNQHEDTTRVYQGQDLDSINIFSLHQDLFLPTCANSGCHDGNFEPDFRTVESSFWGLVQAPVIKKDNEGKFLYRVIPFDVNNSMLWHRLHVDLNGNSGIMPLGLEANSDYPQKKTRYLNRLKLWIESGAPDMFGNLLINENYPPVISGIRLRQNNQWLSRVGVYEPVSVSVSGGDLEVVVSLFDKETQYNVCDNLKVYLSHKVDSFGMDPNAVILPSSPIQMPGLFGEEVQYTWKFDFKPSDYQVGQVVWMRFELEHDGKVFQLPSETSMFLLKKYAAMRIQQ